MKKSLVTWKVAEVPTGRYRSFEKRSWPTATYKGADDIAAQILCEDDYVPSRLAKGEHAPLTLRIRDYSKPTFEWVRATTKFETLEQAKKALDLILDKYPNLTPKEKK